MVPLLERLPVEVRRELREGLGVVVHGDRDVLLRGAELARDLPFRVSVKRLIGRADHTKERSERVHRPHRERRFAVPPGTQPGGFVGERLFR